MKGIHFYQLLSTGCFLAASSVCLASPPDKSLGAAMVHEEREFRIESVIAIECVPEGSQDVQTAFFATREPNGAFTATYFFRPRFFGQSPTTSISNEGVKYIFPQVQVDIFQPPAHSSDSVEAGVVAEVAIRNKGETIRALANGAAEIGGVAGVLKIRNVQFPLSCIVTE